MLMFNNDGKKSAPRGKNTRTELNIKDKIRERDGDRCVVCGKTNDQHHAETGKQLHVHRLIPGAPYEPHWCITLCTGCHPSRPNTVAEAIWHPDTKFLAFNTFDPEDRELWSAIEQLLADRGIEVDSLSRDEIEECRPRKTETCQHDAELLRMARIVCNETGQSLTEYLSNILRPFVTADYEKVLAKLTAEIERRKSPSP